MECNHASLKIPSNFIRNKAVNLCCHLGCLSRDAVNWCDNKKAQ